MYRLILLALCFVFMGLPAGAEPVPCSEDLAKEMYLSVAFGELLKVQKILQKNPLCVDAQAQIKIKKYGCHVTEPPSYECNVTKPPLLRAVSLGDFEMVQLLVEHGADVNYQNPNIASGFSPLQIAVKELVYKEYGLFRKWFLSWSDAYKMVQFLVEKGADVNAQNALYGNNVLHIAVDEADWHGEMGTIKLVLTFEGLQINAKNKKGETPLAIALGAGSKRSQKVAELLRQHGAGL